MKDKDNIYEQNEPVLATANVSNNTKLEQYKEHMKSQIEEFINDSQIEEAKDLINEYEKSINEDVDILCMKGIISVIVQDLESAQIFFETALKIDGNNFDILYNLGFIFKVKNEYDKAINMFQMSLSLVDNKEVSEQIVQEINELLQKLSNVNEGQASLESFQKNTKDNIYNLIENGHLLEAKNLISEYERNISNDLDIYSLKGIIAMIDGDTKNAEIIFKEGLTIEPTSGNILYNLAYLYEIEENLIEAYKCYVESKKYQQDINIKKQIEEKLNVLYKSKVTIVIPAYNQKEYLKETIESCLMQDYPNLEILVGDDCSTDGTYEMMLEYKENTRVKYVRNDKNLGAGNNTSYLFQNYVNSKFVMMLNHDDYLIKSNYISSTVAFFNENPNLSLVWANCRIKNEIIGKESTTNFKNKKITNGREYFINYETQGYPHITGLLTSVFDFDKLKLTQYGNEKSKSKDTFLYLNLMLVGDVGFIEDCVAVYRVHSNGLSLNMPLEFDQSTIHEFEKLKTYTLNKKISSKKQMENWINNRVFSYIFWRFSNLWNSNNKKEALKLLMSISTKYVYAFERILNSI